MAGPGAGRPWGIQGQRGQSLKQNLKGEQVEKRNRREPGVSPKVFLYILVRLAFNTGEHRQS